MFNKYLLTASIYGTIRHLYYSNNIIINEKLPDNRNITRPLLIGEHITSVMVGIPISIMYAPFIVVNDILYIERKKKNILIDSELYIPLSISVACNSYNIKFRQR